MPANYNYYDHATYEDYVRTVAANIRTDWDLKQQNLAHVVMNRVMSRIEWEQGKKRYNEIANILK
jgi:DNA-binding transcriptional regulator YiaG